MYKVVMRNETETFDISNHDIFVEWAEAKAACLSSQSPAYLFEVWEGNNLLGTWENGKERI